MATSDKRQLLTILDELAGEQLKSFKWNLNQQVLDGFSPIPKGQLEGIDKLDIVDKMVEKYTLDGALKISVKVLIMIDRNDLVDQLRRQSQTVSSVDVFLPPKPRTRADFLHYSCQLTLDPNTAYKDLSLSEENRKVTCLDQTQPYPDHPDRFTQCYQVLCREALSGRCYWEVEWRGGLVYIAVSYKDISRTAKNSIFGNNDKSWRLWCSSAGYSFRHNRVETQVSGPQSSRVGVYLDHKAGSLSFYSVSDTVTLLHRVQTTFTQPLYPGFYLGYYNTSAEISKVW